MFHAKDNLRGSLLMVFSMAGFAIEDMFIKWAAADLPPGQILLFIGLAGGAVFALMAAAQGASVWSARAFHPAVIGRNIGEMAGTYGFILALARIDLSTLSAVVQAMPLFVTMGAALFLGEKVGWRRWTAIAVGFGGVLLVIRPGFGGFDAQALWAVLAVVGLGARDIFTRRVPAEISSVQVSAWGFVAVAALGAGMLAVSGGASVPTLPQTGLLFGAVSFSIVAYWSLTAAMRLGEISAITPFRYSRLIFALIIGALVFGERPDLITLTGAAVIIASGLYTFARERAVKQRALSINATPR
jgi:drug/metabolite transporter (DMT)-like permease